MYARNSPASDPSNVSLQPEDLPGVKFAERLVFVVLFLIAATTGVQAGYLGDSGELLDEAIRQTGPRRRPDPSA